MINYRPISYTKAHAFCVAVFESYGFTQPQSRDITDVLLCADVFGIESHGIQRLTRYHQEIGDGFVKVDAQPRILHETPLSAVMDADKCMGQLIAVEAMELAISKAKKSGLGMVSVRNSNHFGIAGYYSRIASDNQLLGICMTNSEAIGVPTFGKRAMLGTNPIALSMPATPVCFSFDAATTVVPRGKLEVYHKNGKPLPQSWAIDSTGHPTTDSGLVLNNIINKLGGGIAPLGGSGEDNGGHKGYGFALMVELFTGIFSGGSTSNYVNTRTGSVDICHWFAAMDYGLFGDKTEIEANFSKLLQELRDSDKADGKYLYDRSYYNLFYVAQDTPKR